jgi:sugar phosphate permease
MFYGWWIVSAVFVAQAISSGLATYSFGLFQLPIAEEFDVSRSVVSLGMVGSMLLGAVLGPIFGRTLDRGSVRGLMLTSGAVMAGTYLAIAFVPSIALLGLFFVIGTASGQLGLGPLAASKLVATWFSRLRGRALGVSAVGTSAGGLLAPPLLAAAMAAWGWRGAAIAAAATLAVIALPVVGFVIRDRPSDVGLYPDGAIDPPATPLGGAAAAWPFKRLLGDRNFWVITLVIGSIFGVVTGIITNLPAVVAEFGIEAQQAAWILSLLSVSGIAGKLVFGAVADKFNKRVLVWIGMLMLLAFLIILLSEPGFGALVVGGVAMGFALGGALPLWGALIGDCYGPEAFGSVMGWMGPAMLPLTLSGVQLLPWCYDSTGSYTPALQGFLVALAVAASLLLLLRPPDRASA